MSENALMERTETVAGEPAVREPTTTTVIRIHRDHLALLDWERRQTSDRIEALSTPPPVRRVVFGPYEISVAVLTLASAVAGVLSLLRLG